MSTVASTSGAPIHRTRIIRPRTGIAKDGFAWMMPSMKADTNSGAQNVSGQFFQAVTASDGTRNCSQKSGPKAS